MDELEYIVTGSNCSFELTGSCGKPLMRFQMLQNFNRSFIKNEIKKSGIIESSSLTDIWNKTDLIQKWVPECPHEFVSDNFIDLDQFDFDSETFYFGRALESAGKYEGCYSIGMSFSKFSEDTDKMEIDVHSTWFPMNFNLIAGTVEMDEFENRRREYNENKT